MNTCFYRSVKAEDIQGRGKKKKFSSIALRRNIYTQSPTGAMLGPEMDCCVFNNTDISFAIFCFHRMRNS